MRPAVQLGFSFANVRSAPVGAITSTFGDNMSLPVHRWFRYSAGFSAAWVQELLRREKAEGRENVLDPFAGSGTVPLEGELSALRAIGLEAHPFVLRIAQAKLLWREDADSFRAYALGLLNRAQSIDRSDQGYPKLINQCFPPSTLMRLDALRQAWQAVADDSPMAELAWLALTSILRVTSPVGTAQWQYVLPNKSKARSLDPFEAYALKLDTMVEDMVQLSPQADVAIPAVMNRDDARECRSVPDGWADLIVTSPPYANNYDYADATRLEMSFWREVSSWADLHDRIRRHLITSCTQHTGRNGSLLEDVLGDPLLQPIHDEITEVCRQLALAKELHGGRKAYDAMIAGYFRDMASVWIALRRVSSSGALVCFVIGDSAPYGVYVPVDRWLGELALAAGFHSYTFEKIRDRNTKWKNRKHRVPLHEGHLWVRG